MEVVEEGAEVAAGRLAVMVAAKNVVSANFDLTQENQLSVAALVAMYVSHRQKGYSALLQTHFLISKD